MFLDLHKEKRAVISKLFKATALRCSTYEVDIRYLDGAAVACIEKNLTGRLDLVLAEPPYNVQRY